MGIFARRCQTIESKPLEAYLDLGEDSEDLDNGIHEIPWLIELGSEPVESDINRT
jgi:hypothetical protein